MNTPIRWGILGCGKIANKFAADLKLVKDATLMAIASRDSKRCKEFSELFSVSHAYNTYEELVTSPYVDVIYVATPHGFHYEHVMLCLTHGKAVLCEKAFALNYRKAKEMVDFAQTQKIFLMEAFWTKFLPQYKKVMELLNEGVIGDVKMIQADFGFRAFDPPPQRLYDPALGGGSLLDIGIYPVFLAQSILGLPVTIHAVMTPYSTGVDEQCSMVLSFENGALASLMSTFAADTPVDATIIGTKGRIHMRDRFHNAVSKLELIIDREPLKSVEVFREEGYGYQFEARHVNECLLKGLIESPVMTHDDTLQLMQTLDRIRKACGIKYSVDDVG